MLMKSQHLYLALVGLSILVCCAGQEEELAPATSQDQEQPLFSLMDPEVSGVTFQNNVADGKDFNILTYRNFYNGGGVAIGDINNDSLPDLYFTSNQEQNRLYLNLGEWKFRDITERAGVSGTKSWSTGVTMADVNGDGFLDIYVCNSGDIAGEGKSNELFINQGDMTFKEEAQGYGLDNSGYSTHAAFFDYDGDGDLDCYILNNSFRDPSKIELYRKVRETSNDPGGDKLMRNDNGKFRDVTRNAGIFSSDIGFGLGVAVSDLNGDMHPDIYVSNDFWERDYLYLNQGDGTFKESLVDRINYCSISSMGADIADLNNDGYPEIFTTDMLPADNYRLKTTMAFDPYHLEDLKYRANFHYQMVQNCLHLNNGNADFQEIALLSGVAATDWSWGALIFDFENDGYRDIFVSNGILRDLMSMDFRDFLADNQSREQIIAEKGAYDHRDFIAYMPSQPLKNFAYTHSGVLNFRNVATDMGLAQPSFSNGSAYGDLDNDGDLDLVVNNINQPSFVYQNHAELNPHHFIKLSFQGPEGNPFGIGCKLILKTPNGITTGQNYNTRGFQSSIEPQIVLGLGDLETIEQLEVIWPDGSVQNLTDISADQHIRLDHRDAQNADTQYLKPKAPTPIYKEVSNSLLPQNAIHRENQHNDFDYEILLPSMLSTEGPRIITGDVNQDQLDDFILLGARNDPDKLFIQTAQGKFRFSRVQNFLDDSGFESTCGAMIDYDQDGDLDLMIGSGGNETAVDRQFYLIRLYRNDGQGNFQADPSRIPQVVGNFSTLEAADFNGDGNVEVFLGARNVPGNYGLPPRSYLLSYRDGAWQDIAGHDLGNIGMVTDASWGDLDNDNDLDLVVVGDWMEVSLFYNQGNRLSAKQSLPQSKGWWNRVEINDLDQDGLPELILGNQGLNTKFKATAGKPLQMYVNDFDNNGKSEFIINWYPPQDSMSYPFATKMELVSQLPGLRKDILKYEQYGNKTIDSLFSGPLREQSILYTANYLESAIAWNRNGSFEMEALPLAAQVSPVYSILCHDLDGDGIKDIWLGGNFYAMKPQTGRHDASNGVFLRGGNSLVYLPPEHSGLNLNGQVRDGAVLKVGDQEVILVARNNDSMVAFQK